jgi:hypothetical protein
VVVVQGDYLLIRRSCVRNVYKNANCLCVKSTSPDVNTAW